MNKLSWCQVSCQLGLFSGAEQQVHWRNTNTWEVTNGFHWLTAHSSFNLLQGAWLSHLCWGKPRYPQCTMVSPPCGMITMDTKLFDMVQLFSPSTYLTCSLIGAHLQANGSLVIWLLRLSLWVIKMPSGAISSHASLTGTFICPHLHVKGKKKKSQKWAARCTSVKTTMNKWGGRKAAHTMVQECFSNPYLSYDDMPHL